MTFSHCCFAAYLLRCCFLLHVYKSKLHLQLQTPVTPSTVLVFDGADPLSVLFFALQSHDFPDASRCATSVSPNAAMWTASLLLQIWELSQWLEPRKKQGSWSETLVGETCITADLDVNSCCAQWAHPVDHCVNKEAEAQLTPVCVRVHVCVMRAHTILSSSGGLGAGLAR